MSRLARVLVIAGIVAVTVVALSGLARSQDSSPVPATPVQPVQPGQPGYDGIRLERDGVLLPYSVSVERPPLLITTPDGGAWAFFTARALANEGRDTSRLYAARFDPVNSVWLAAKPLPGGTIQFGPAATVDRQGTVYLVYSDRATSAEADVTSLVYTFTSGEAAWASPTPILPDPNAGHQMMPALAVDADDQLHLLWRDQRNVSTELRAASVGNADLFASHRVDGVWSPPVQLNDRSNPELNASWPHLALDRNRLVAVWSVHKGTTPDEMNSPALRVDWSTRPLTGSDDAWSAPRPLLERDDGLVGGTLLDLAADSAGGVVLAYSRYYKGSTPSRCDLFLRRLEPGESAWAGDLPLAFGDLGYYPSLGAGSDGRVAVAFNHGSGRGVEVGVVAVDRQSPRPSPVMIPTTGEEGEHGRAAVTFAANGGLWVIYMHAPIGRNVIELRATRGVVVAG